MIQPYYPKNDDLKIGNLFVHNHRRDITVIIIERFDGGVKIFTCTGKTTVWSLESFRSVYRKIQ